MLSGKVIRKGGREREEEEGGREDLVDEEEGVKSMSVQNLGVHLMDEVGVFGIYLSYHIVMVFLWGWDLGKY